MVSTVDLLRQGNRVEIWSKYCGFLDLSLHEFMSIQKRLLMEQIGLLGECELGQKLLGDRVPATIDEFRSRVQLTTYADYKPCLDEKREDCLPLKPRWWLRTSGRTGDFGGYKWVPYPPDMARRLGETAFAVWIMAAVDERGQFPLKEGDRVLYGMAPFPYISGAMARALLEEFPVSFLPPLEQAERMPYEERIQEGLRLALRDGMDHAHALAIVLARIAQQFSSGSGHMRLSQLVMHPAAMARLARGFARARRAGRNHLLPKDLWRIKGVATGGTDTVLFREQICESWGRDPIEAYGCTEGSILAVQPWANEGMVFVPHQGFFEFISTDEFAKNDRDPSYTPQTVLLDQVELGGVYEVVITNFYGGIFTRYRTGDLIRISALKDDSLGIQLPKMLFHSKTRDIIDLGAFVRVTERMIWKAIEELQIRYIDWSARKEYHEGHSYLYVYIEIMDHSASLDHVQNRLGLNLSEMDEAYNDMKEMMGLDPLRVVYLREGAFSHFARSKQAQGADPAHMKAAHMQISDEDLALLTEAGN